MAVLTKKGAAARRIAEAAGISARMGRNIVNNCNKMSEPIRRCVVLETWCVQQGIDFHSLVRKPKPATKKGTTGG